MTAMEVRTSAPSRKVDIWAALAEPLPADAISWRIDSKPVQKGGKYYARFVCYVEAGTVRKRLDSVVPGEWDLTLTELPNNDDDHEQKFNFKARLQVLGVIREDVGSGRDHKNAATDAFKRAAVRFGIGHELYEMGQNWVQVDSDSKFAKPVEDPQEAYIRRNGRDAVQAPRQEQEAPAQTAAEKRKRMTFVTCAECKTQYDSALPECPTCGGQVSQASAPQAPPPSESSEPGCPKCGGKMWDNRHSKRNPKAPDFKCRDRACDGVIWPPKPGDQRRIDPDNVTDSLKLVEEEDNDDLPF